MADVPNVVQVSVSGGRTSAYMAKLLLDRRHDVADWLGVPEPDLKYVFIFANTGMEHGDTLRFLRDIDRAFGLGLVWVEAVVNPVKGQGTKHRVVTFDSAFRRDEWRHPDHPFHATIRKYGVPNTTWNPCTREMKLRAMTSYMRSIGCKPGDFHTAIGIRDDERRRVSSSKEADIYRIVYPLVELEPTDKDDILEWASELPFDLAIPEYMGNCVTCSRKASRSWP